jgi:polar amino acid transport system permease protein
MNLIFFQDWLSWLPELLPGLGISLQLAAISIVAGSCLGLVLAIIVSSPNPVVRIPAIILVEIGRGIPALVLLQMVYFGLPSANLTFDAFWSAAVALALNTGAYTSEILRGGLQAVPAGEVEASEALGMSRMDTLRFILIPPGIRIATAPMLGFAILIFQATSLAFTISLQELLSRGYAIGSETFEYLSVLVLVGVLYLLITVPGGWMTTYLERRMSRHLL